MAVVRFLPPLLAVTLVIMPPASPAATSAQESVANRQPAVLFLAIEDVTRPYVRLMFEAFSDAMLLAPDPPDMYFESLDALRFGGQDTDALREWLRRKYRDTRIDLVVPLGEDALGFLVDKQVEPWPGSRVLYLEAGYIRDDVRKALPEAGGLVLEDHTLDALKSVKAILPETTQVAMVLGSADIEIARWRDFGEKVQNAGMEPIALTGRSIEEMRAAVAHLPLHTVVYVLAPTVDAKGHVLGPTQACEVMSSASNVPIFTLGAHDLGCGVVGGLLRDWSVVGRLLGEEALARLKLPSADVVNVPVARYTTLAFDDRQLQRWGIPERRLPPGAVVRFREASLWRDHRALVLTAIGVTLLQSLLIGGLVFEHRRRRRAEMESRRNLAAMAHLDRRAAMGELATSLAHELNQPLNAILQNAGVAQILLASNTLPPSLGEIPDIISDIRKDDLRASEIIRRMRGLLQKHELESHPVDLNEVAQDTVAIVRPDARSRDVDLHVELADGVRPIRGDRVHLQQVLLNLLMNALDAVATMPADRRRVHVSTRQSNGEVRMAVADTGIGIPADHASEIFEPFYTTKSKGGMGMGLAIARSIVEAHAGQMAAENNPGGGATVWFSVPVSGSDVTKVL